MEKRRNENSIPVRRTKKYKLSIGTQFSLLFYSRYWMHVTRTMTDYTI